MGPRWSWTSTRRRRFRGGRGLVLGCVCRLAGPALRLERPLMVFSGLVMSRTPLPEPLLSFTPRRRPTTAVQRLPPFGARLRPHADWHQAVVRLGGGGQREGRLCEGQRAQATSAPVTAAPLTASCLRQLAVPTQSGSSRRETADLQPRRLADRRKHDRMYIVGNALAFRRQRLRADDPRDALNIGASKSTYQRRARPN